LVLKYFHFLFFEKKRQQKKNSGEKRRDFSPLSEMNAGMDKGVRVATEYENGNAKDIGKERLKIPA
jgi:hypothetical protein